MIGRFNRTLWVAGLLFTVNHTAYAHHSFATHYDANNVVEISGTLSAVKMRSPHSFFEVDVTRDNGATETWEVEAHAVPILRRLGINQDTLKVGDSVTIRGPRSRRPEKLLLFGARISTTSGEQFEMLDSIRKAPDNRISDTREGIRGVDRLTGMWMTFISGQRVADSPMPLNAAGILARDNFNAQFNSSSECVTPNLPSLLMIPYIYEITNYRNTITIFHEYGRLSRQVTLGSTEPNITDPQFGQRTGRFENGVLVIESTGFPALTAGLASGWEPNGNGADIPSSDQKTLIERYTVNEDGSELTLDYTVSDPAYLTEPYSTQIVWYRIPDDSPIYEFDCDAEIASRSTQNAVPVE
ncbi:MAG: DUF6152 family protein [Proteobacteria bacterium]|nr:DUF6152 family protein [Pseudomonadota bacterium]